MNDKNYSLRLRCRNCEYDDHSPNAVVCIICRHPLPSKKTGKVKPKKMSMLKNIFLSKTFLENLEYIGLATILCIGIVTFYTVKKADKDDFTGKDIPKGLFNYSSENSTSSFASLIYNTIERKIEQEYPQSDFRHVEYYNNESSVQKLIEGDLSFIYINRPLSVLELEKAQLRGYKFKQLPIGIKNTETLYLVIRSDNTLEAQAGRAYYELLSSSIGYEIVKNAKIIPAFVDIQESYDKKQSNKS